MIIDFIIEFLSYLAIFWAFFLNYYSIFLVLTSNRKNPWNRYKMFDQVFFVLLFLLLFELYFTTKAIFFLSTSLILVISISFFAIKYSLDLLFVTLIIVSVSSTLTLIILLFSSYSRQESISIFKNFFLSIGVFFFFCLVSSTFFLTSNDIINFKWVNYVSLSNDTNYQITKLLHIFVMFYFSLESAMLNVIIFFGLMSALIIISRSKNLMYLKKFKKIGVALKQKRISRRLNSFSSFFRK